MSATVAVGRDAGAGARRSPPTFVSVVMPVLNEARYVAAQLEALAGQTYRGEWELVVSDNGSVDGTVAVVEAWRPRLPRLTIVDASDRPGLNHARNAGVGAAAGDFVAFCDGDDVVAPGWLAALAEAAPRGEIVAGALERERLNPRDGSLRWPAGLHVRHDFLVGAPGGNCGVWRSVAADLGWDERFRFEGSDTEFSWRAQLGGHEIVFTPDAVVHVRWPESLGELARKWYRYGRAGGQLYRTFRHEGMPRESPLRSLIAWAWLLLTVVRLLESQPARRRWVRVAAYRAGRLAGSARARVLFV